MAPAASGAGVGDGLHLGVRAARRFVMSESDQFSVAHDRGPDRGFGLGRASLASAIACVITSRSSSEVMSILEAAELLEELADILEVPVDARKSDVGYRVDGSQLVKHVLAESQGGHLLLPVSTNQRST